jgi:hypothetical protein
VFPSLIGLKANKHSLYKNAWLNIAKESIWMDKTNGIVINVKSISLQ